MTDKMNVNSINTDDIIGVMSSENFINLPDKTQKQVLSMINSNKNSGGGFMGLLFGNKKENAAMNIAFSICLIMAIIGVICMYSGNEIWNVIIPSIMTAVGYIFGRADK